MHRLVPIYFPELTLEVSCFGASHQLLSDADNCSESLELAKWCTGLMELTFPHGVLVLKAALVPSEQCFDHYNLLLSGQLSKSRK